jgi:hypothetical protein
MRGIPVIPVTKHTRVRHLERAEVSLLKYAGCYVLWNVAWWEHEFFFAYVRSE